MKKNIFSFPITALKSIRNFALKKKDDLEEKINNLNQEDPFLNNDRLNDNSDDADAKEQVDHERVDAIKKELLKNLEEIKTTLKKIDDGSYGFCEKCKKLIDTARLAVTPFARYCLSCEKKIDENKK